MGKSLLMKLSNDVEKYEIEVTKMGQNYSFFSYSKINDDYITRMQWSRKYQYQLYTHKFALSSL